MITSSYGEIVVYVINKECLVNEDYPIIRNGIWDNPWETEDAYDVEAEIEYGGGFDDYEYDVDSY